MGACRDARCPWQFSLAGCDPSIVGSASAGQRCLRRPIAIGLHTNTANRGEAFDECRTGLDHVSFGVADRDELAAWVARLDELGIQHTGIRDEQQPLAYSTVVFRDPDNIQLEFITLG